MTSPKGRITRFDYNVKFLMLCLVLGIIAGMIDYSYLGNAVTDPNAKKYATWFVQIVLIWPGIVAAIKRLHDLNYSGWWLLTGYLLPVVIGSGLLGYFGAKQNIIGMIAVAILLVCLVVAFILVLCCGKGTVGPNRFGSDPNENTTDAVEGIPL